MIAAVFSPIKGLSTALESTTATTRQLADCSPLLPLPLPRPFYAAITVARHGPLRSPISPWRPRTPADIYCPLSLSLSLEPTTPRPVSARPCRSLGQGLSANPPDPALEERRARFVEAFRWSAMGGRSLDNCLAAKERDSTTVVTLSARKGRGGDVCIHRAAVFRSNKSSRRVPPSTLPRSGSPGASPSPAGVPLFQRVPPSFYDPYTTYRGIFFTVERDLGVFFFFFFRFLEWNLKLIFASFP